MLNKDIEIAQKIVLNGNKLRKESFHDYSFIYKTTNESIRSYKELYQDKETIFSIIGSSDQIFNYVLGGAKTIDIADITHFAQYFFQLKKAAILTLTKNEYLKFFYTGSTYEEEFDENLYLKIKENLTTSSKTFWDSLFNFFDSADIYNSMLFSSEVFTKKGILAKNPYLDDENYKKLQSLLEKVTFKVYTKDIYTLAPNLQNKYDFVNLSNIYSYDKSKNHQLYQSLLETFPLNHNGIILTYLYTHHDEGLFQMPNIQPISLDNNDKVAIYQRKQ